MVQISSRDMWSIAVRVMIVFLVAGLVATGIWGGMSLLKAAGDTDGIVGLAAPAIGAVPYWIAKCEEDRHRPELTPDDMLREYRKWNMHGPHWFKNVTVRVPGTHPELPQPCRRVFTPFLPVIIKPWKVSE